MGSVSTQNMFGDVKKDPLAPMVTSVPATELKLPELVELPLVIVKGNFRCLDQLDEDSLEDFLRYLCRFTANKEQRSRFARPVWWSDLLPFSRQFAKGSKLAYGKNKDKRLRLIIKTAYRFYSCKELIQLSAKFSEMHVLSLEFQTYYDGTVIVINKCYGSALVRIPGSNLKYDYDWESKKISNEVNLIEIITIDDESPKKKIPHLTNLSDVQKLAAVRPPNFKVNESPLLNSTILHCNSTRDKKECPTSLCSDQRQPDVTIVLTDSDDDVKESNSAETKKPQSTLTRRSKRTLLNINQTNQNSKKKSLMFDRLTSLEKSGSVSYYPCITISDYEEEENDSDDCQIISVFEPQRNTFPEIKDIFSLSEGNTNEYEKINFPRTKRRRKVEHEERGLKLNNVVEENSNSLINLIKPTSENEEPKDVKPPDQENFLANFCLIRKEKYDQVRAYVQPFKKLRRLRLPLYHMPLDLLPALVARGVISASHLVHNHSNEVVPERKLKRLKKPRIRYRLPPGVHLKQCSVVLKRLSNDFLLNASVKLNDCK